MSIGNLSMHRHRVIQPTLVFVVTQSLLLVGCSCINRVQLPADELGSYVLLCAGGWDAETGAKLVARYEELKRSGELEWIAARKAGGIFWTSLTEDAQKTTAYTQYLGCIMRYADNFVLADQRPKVLVAGSSDDYTTYGLSEWTQTSTSLIHEQLGESFRVSELTVDYGWNDLDYFRQEMPADIVIHASAFDENAPNRNQAVDKFQAVIESLLGIPQARFLVFSRLPPENPALDLCQRWTRQVNFLSDRRFGGRLIFYPLPRDESHFKGKAGQEIGQIVRCQTGLEADEFCSDYVRERAQEAQRLIANSTC